MGMGIVLALGAKGAILVLDAAKCTFLYIR